MRRIAVADRVWFRALAVLVVIAVALILLASPSTAPSAAQSTNYSLRFYGNGFGDIDRVKISIDTPARPVDVGGNFTLEFWMKSASGNNSGSCTEGGVTWINGNIMFDRDINGDGDYGDYGVSLYVCGQPIRPSAGAGRPRRPAPPPSLPPRWTAASPSAHSCR